MQVLDPIWYRAPKAAKRCCWGTLPLLPSLFPTPHWHPCKAGQLSIHQICITCPSLPCDYSQYCGLCDSSTPLSFFFCLFPKNVNQNLLIPPSSCLRMLKSTRAPHWDAACAVLCCAVPQMLHVPCVRKAAPIPLRPFHHVFFFKQHCSKPSSPSQPQSNCCHQLLHSVSPLTIPPWFDWWLLCSSPCHLSFSHTSASMMKSQLDISCIFLS